jgi:hypothetical protein
MDYWHEAKAGRVVSGFLIKFGITDMCQLVEYISKKY